MSDLLGIACACLLALAAHHWLLLRERRGERAGAVVLLLGALAVDAALYQNQNLVPSGIFHPGLGADPDPDDGLIETAFSFRLVDLLVLAALAARVRAGSVARRPTPAGIAWMALLVWLVAAAAIGIASGHDDGIVVFQAKVVAYLAAGALAIGIGERDLRPGGPFERLALLAAPVAAALTATHVANVTFASDWPLVPLVDLGMLAGDAATLFAAIGLLALAGALVAAKRRLWRLLVPAALFLPTLVSGQRAALLGLGASLVLLVLLVPAAPMRVRVTRVELALCAAACCALALAAVVAAAAVRQQPVQLPFASELTSSFGSLEKRLSGASRVNQWQEVRPLIRDRPWLGHGLGAGYRYFDPGERAIIDTDVTHNVGLDLLLRTGVVGLGLFVGAVVLSVAAGILAWRRLAGDRLAALALAGSALLVGLVAKGMFESLFEKYRLAVLIGIAAGLAVAPAGALGRRRVNDAPEAAAWA